jgi:hypothetical protein
MDISLHFCPEAAAICRLKRRTLYTLYKLVFHVSYSPEKLIWVEILLSSYNTCKNTIHYNCA